MSIQAILTVYFEDPFWVGIYEEIDKNQHLVYKITYGKEPNNPEILLGLLKNYHQFHFVTSTMTRPSFNKPLNPKRKQRLAQQLMKQPQTSTKAQAILKEELEKMHKARKAMRKQRNQEQLKQLYATKQQKRKEKHKGH